MPPRQQAPPAGQIVPFTWGLYFPSVEYTPNDRRAKLIRGFAEFLSTDAGWQFLTKVGCHERATVFEF
eukprot:778736-Prorocentrum_minimum.AAC.8